jgi:predicted nucleotidyltransferase
MAPSLQSAIDSITAQLIEKYKPEKIILFGSAARGDAAPDSDVDLLIICSQFCSLSRQLIGRIDPVIL